MSSLDQNLPQNNIQLLVFTTNLAAPNSPGSASTTTAGHLSPTNALNNASATTRPQINGGRFDFEDGGTYCGGWDEGIIYSAENSCIFDEFDETLMYRVWANVINCRR